MDSSSDQLISHELAANNVLLGSSRFLALRLPSQWELGRGVGGPEITATHVRNHIKWVASGKAWYVLNNNEQRWAMELMVEAGHLRHRLRAGQTLIEVLGHEAQVRWWEKGRGIFQRRRVTYVEVAFNCPKSERFVRVELSGWCDRAAFDEVLQFIPNWRCH